MAVAAPLQVFVTPLWLQTHIVLFYIALFAPVVMLCGTLCCRGCLISFPSNMIFLFFFTVFEAFTVGCVSSFYTTESVCFTLAVAAAVTLGLSLYAAFTKSDFTGCAPFMWSLLIGLISFGNVTFLFQMLGFRLPPGVQLVYSVFAVMIYFVYIVHDTQLIIGLFLQLLELFGEKK